MTASYSHNEERIPYTLDEFKDYYGREETYSVCQFFDDDIYDYEVEDVSLNVAIQKFQFLTNNVTAKFGITKKVTITDSSNCPVMMWEYGKGILLPKELSNAEKHNIN